MINTLRGWIFYLVLALSIIVMTLLVLTTWPFTSAEWRFRAICRPWCVFVLAALKAVCGLSYRVKGMENVPDASTPVMVLSKHQSAWDPFGLGTVIPQPSCYLYKKSLNRIPFLGWALFAMDMLSIDRKDGRSSFQKFLEKGREKLKRGWWICLFPEGTRCPPGGHVRYKTGGARVACATGTPVLPIAHNAGLFWPKDSIAKRPGVITISIGPLIRPEGLDPLELTAKVEAWIEDELQRLD